jgi:hypothetical protein
VVVGPGARSRGGYSGVVWPARLRDGYPAVCGSGTELWPGTAPGVESPAEWSSGSADLWGGDLAGRQFLSWSGVALHDLSL